MDKLYSKQALILKATYCFCLPFLHQLLTAGELGDSVVWLLLSFVLIGCMYTVPFWTTLYGLKKSRAVPIARCVLLDLATCLAPAVLAALVYECGVHMFVQASAQNGLYTVLIFFILLSVSGVFWLLYLLTGKHNRP